MANCEICGANLELVGRVHRCRPAAKIEAGLKEVLATANMLIRQWVARGTLPAKAGIVRLIVQDQVREFSRA